MNRARAYVGLAAGLLFANVSAADYALGLAAFERGDVATAEGEFTPLAKAGFPAAQYSLAMLYLKTKPPDYAKARSWLEKSALQGLAESQYMLGMLTLYGVGTAKNTEQGMQWLERARDQDNDDARLLLEQLEQARLKEAESAQRKAEQARNLRAELERAEAAEQALKKRLEQSRQREKALAAEQQNLMRARATDAGVKDKMRIEQARLEAALETLRLRLAEAERAREMRKAPTDNVAMMAAPGVDTVVEAAPGETMLAGKVVEVLPDGVLLSNVSRRIHGQIEPFPDDFVVFLNIADPDGLSEGQEVAYPAEPSSPYRYKYESGAVGRIRAFRATEQ